VAKKTKNTEEQFEESQPESEQETTEETNEENEIDQAISAAFQVTMDDGKDEDEVKMAMIGAGCTFKKIAALYNRLMVEFGYQKSRAEINEILDNILGSQELTDEDIFYGCVEQLCERLEIEEKSAAARIRTWAAKNDVEYFKPVPTGGAGRSNFDDRMYAWLLENMDSGIEAFEAYLNDVGTPNTLRFKPRHLEFYRFVESIKNRA
jgi:hypothetical protein